MEDKNYVYVEGGRLFALDDSNLKVPQLKDIFSILDFIMTSNKLEGPGSILSPL